MCIYIVYCTNLSYVQIWVDIPRHSQPLYYLSVVI